MTTTTTLLQQLESIGPLSASALDAATQDCTVGCVLDCPHPHAPLLICFGFVEWEGIANFDFYGRSKKFEQQTNTPLNRILLRDTASLWYQHGCAGMGHNAEDLARALALLITKLQPSQILLVGQSMGAYAALQFGASLQARFGGVRVLAFGPLSYLDVARAQQDGERRFLPVMQSLLQTAPAGWVPDLAAHLKQVVADGVALQCRIVMGIANPPPAGDNCDALHADRFADIAGVEVVSFPEAPHAVVEWLKAEGRIDTVFQAGLGPIGQSQTIPTATTAQAGLTLELEGRIAPDGSPYAIASVSGFNPPRQIDETWRNWLAENLLHGGPALGLVCTMVQHGFDAAATRAEIVNISRSPAMAAGKRLVDRVAKRDWLLDVQRKNTDLDPANHRIAVVPALDRETFLKEHYARGRPVVMTGAFEHWPARSKWTLDYIKRTCGDQQVQVQSGRERNKRYETQAEAHRTLMRLSDYIDTLAAIEASGATSNDLYITAGNNSHNESALSALWPDTQPAIETYLNPQSPEKNGFFWMGPPGTVTPLHHDLTHNFMAQVIGRKRVLLIDPVFTPRLYNELHCFSDVDLREIDFTRHPLMREVRVMEHILQPGELLFIPIGWWHQVLGLDTSITMTFTNFWWPNDYAEHYRTYGPV